MSSMAERSSAQISLPSSTKEPRPSILKRASYHPQSPTSGALLGSPRLERTTLKTSQPDETMAACFLQYCAMCEKQITTPSNSILYCSEACRRKDSNKPLSAANIMSASASPPTTPSSPRSILQPRVPTGLSPHSDSPVVRIPTDNHGSKADIDPTEWKPKSTRNGRPIANRYNSEAFRYLSSFHRAINKNERNEYNDTPNEFRIDIRDVNAAFATAPTTPSLGNTPTTTASSWSTSTSVDYAGHGGYDFNTRPLMPRQHNRWYSTSVISAAGIDLVTPHIPPPGNAYAKKDVDVGADTPKGGLGAFFGGQAD